MDGYTSLNAFKALSGSLLSIAKIYGILRIHASFPDRAIPNFNLMIVFMVQTGHSVFSRCIKDKNYYTKYMKISEFCSISLSYIYTILTLFCPLMKFVLSLSLSFYSLFHSVHSLSTINNIQTSHPHHKFMNLNEL